MCTEPIALKVINKINIKLKLLYRKNKSLTPELRRMLCNSLILPLFENACEFGIQIIPKSKEKIHNLQKKNIWFRIRLDKIQHISCGVKLIN